MAQPEQVPSPDGARPATTHPGPVLRVAADYAWRLLVIGLAAYLTARVLGQIMTVVVPFTLSVLLTAALRPLTNLLRRLGVPRAIATVLTLVIAVVVIGGIIALVITRAVAEAPQLGREIDALIPRVQHWLINGPLNLDSHTVNHFSSALTRWINRHSSDIANTAVSTGRTVLDLLAGFVMGVFMTIFLLYDGDRVWRFACLALPRAARPRADLAGRAAWTSLSHYVRSVLLVALFHGLAVAITLIALGVPLVTPLALLVALGAFVPVVGSIVTGLLAVSVAALSQGLLAGVVVIAVLLLDAQIEGHILQPLVVGRYVHIHPLAVIIALGVGTILLGIFGALIAVPAVACLNSGIKALVHSDEEVGQPLVPGWRRRPGAATR